MSQLAKRLGFNLTNAFAGNGEGLANFFEGVLATVVQAKTHFDNALLARSKGSKHRGNLLFKVEVDDRLGRGHNSLVFDEVAQVGFFLFTDGCFKGNRLLCNFLGLTHEFDGNIHALGDFVGGRLTAEFLNHLAAGTNLFVDSFNHVNRHADGASLIGDGACDGLANPPGRVRGEFITATPLEFVGATHQANVAFLDEIEELQSAVGVFLGDGNDQSKISFRQFALGLLGVGFATNNDGKSTLQAGGSDFVRFFQIGALLLAGAKILAGCGGGIAPSTGAAAFELKDFLVEGMETLYGVAHDFDQALFLAFIEFDSANETGHFHAGARQFVAGAEIDALVGAGHLLQMSGLFQADRIESFDFVYDFKSLLGLVSDLLFGEFFVVEVNNFLDGLIAVAKLHGNRKQFLQNQRRAGNSLENAKMAPLDSLGNGDFVFASEERNDAHFAQINADGVVGFLGGPGSLLHFGFVAVKRFDANVYFARFNDVDGGASSFGGSEVFVDVDAIALDGGKGAIDLFGCVVLDGKEVVDLVDQQITALLTESEERAELIFFFLKQ